MSNPAKSLTTTTNSMTAASASIHQFSGQDPDYSAYEFLSLCEDVMLGSNVALDEDKMAFVCSRLVPDSRASNLMQSSAFHVNDIGADYGQFKKNFLKVFGGGPKTSLVKQIIHTVEKIRPKESSCSLWDGLVGASQLTNELMRSLEDSKWIAGNDYGKDHAKVIFELIFYISIISEKARLAALTLSFEPGDKVVDFITNLETKIMETNHHSDPPTSDVFSLMASGEEQQTYTVAAAKSFGVCSYCKKPNHDEKRCYRRQREMRKTDAHVGNTNPSGDLAVRPKATTTYTHTDRQKSTGSTVPEGSTPPRWVSNRGPVQFCAVHGQCSHTTDLCRDIAKLRDERQQRGTTSASRPLETDSRQYMRKPK